MATEFNLVAQHGKISLFGNQVTAMSYNGKVPGPVIECAEGEELKLNISNGLGKPTSFRVEGLNVPPGHQYSGNAIEPGCSTTLVMTPPPGSSGIYLYGPYANPAQAAEQRFQGLRGLLVVRGEADKLIPRDDERLIVLQGVSLSGGPSGLRVANLSSTDPAGDYVLVNGEIAPILNSSGPVQFLRLANASISQILRIAVIGPEGANLPVHLLGRGNGYVQTPEKVSEIVIGPGERADVLATFTTSGPYSLALLPYDAGDGNLRPVNNQPIATIMYAQPAVAPAPKPVPSMIYKYGNRAAKTRRSFVSRSDKGKKLQLLSNSPEGPACSDLEAGSGYESWEITNGTEVDQVFSVSGATFQVVTDAYGNTPGACRRDTVLVPRGGKVKILVNLTWGYETYELGSTNLLEASRGLYSTLAKPNKDIMRLSVDAVNSPAPGQAQEVKFSVLASGSIAVLNYPLAGLITDLDAMRRAYAAMRATFPGDAAFDFAAKTYCFVVPTNDLVYMELYPQTAYVAKNTLGVPSVSVYVGSTKEDFHDKSYVLELETGKALNNVGIYDKASGRKLLSYPVPPTPRPPVRVEPLDNSNPWDPGIGLAMGIVTWQDKTKYTGTESMSRLISSDPEMREVYGRLGLEWPKTPNFDYANKNYFAFISSSNREGLFPTAAYLKDDGNGSYHINILAERRPKTPGAGWLVWMSKKENPEQPQTKPGKIAEKINSVHIYDSQSREKIWTSLEGYTSTAPAAELNKYRVVKSAVMSNYKSADPAAYVCTTQEEMHALVTEMIDGTPMAARLGINFETENALVLFVGQKPSAGYSVAINGMQLVDGTATFSYRVIAPGSVAAAVVTSPYIIIAISSAIGSYKFVDSDTNQEVAVKDYPESGQPADPWAGQKPLEGADIASGQDSDYAGNKPQAVLIDSEEALSKYLAWRGLATRERIIVDFAEWMVAAIFMPKANRGDYLMRTLALTETDGTINWYTQKLDTVQNDGISSPYLFAKVKYGNTPKGLRVLNMRGELIAETSSIEVLGLASQDNWQEVPWAGKPPVENKLLASGTDSEYKGTEALGALITNQATLDKYLALRGLATREAIRPDFSKWWVAAFFAPKAEVGKYTYRVPAVVAHEDHIEVYLQGVKAPQTGTVSSPYVFVAVDNKTKPTKAEFKDMEYNKLAEGLLDPELPVAPPTTLPLDNSTGKNYRDLYTSQNSSYAVAAGKGYIITGQNAYSRVWNMAAGRVYPTPTVPVVDFKSECVVAYFLGQYSTGGHSVKVTEIKVSEKPGNKTLDIYLDIRHPKNGEPVTQALTSPCVLVAGPVAPTWARFFDQDGKMLGVATPE